MLCVHYITDISDVINLINIQIHVSCRFTKTHTVYAPCIHAAPGEQRRNVNNAANDVKTMLQRMMAICVKILKFCTLNYTRSSCTDWPGLRMQTSYMGVDSERTVDQTGRHLNVESDPKKSDPDIKGVLPCETRNHDLCGPLQGHAPFFPDVFFILLSICFY